MMDATARLIRRPARVQRSRRRREQAAAAAGGRRYESQWSLAMTPSYVYAIGRVEARFPNLAAEKEFAQATGRTDTAGKTDQQTFHAVLSERQNRYLVRQLCWVLTIQGLETYLLPPRDPADIDLLVEAIRPAPAPMTSMSSSVCAVPSPRRRCATA